LLISPFEAARLPTLGNKRSAIISFAEEIGIAPGIVVGRLQKEGLLEWKTQLNQLKVRYEWDAT
jgi:hypothetical protein